MGIGAGIFLIAIGAILTFALEKSIEGIDLDVVGIILMLVGLVGIALDLAIFAPRRRSYPTTVAQPGYESRTIIERDRL